MRQLTGEDVVLPLVEESTGLLPGEQVGLQRHLALPVRDESVERPPQHALGQRQPFVTACRDVVALHHHPSARERHQLVDDRRLPLLRGLGERLDRQRVAVAVDDEAGQQVPLAVHQSYRTRPRKQPLPQRHRQPQPLGDQLVGRSVLAGQQPQRDANRGA